MSETGVPDISAIICTYNREEMLRKNLESMAGQTLLKNRFEVLVVDDGSTDGTKQVADSFYGRMNVRYLYQRNAGPASARNHGIFAAQGKVVFFFDDDDIAYPTLLEEILKTHENYPGENYAVLNYTGWAPGLEITPLMHYVTEVGCFLFSYPSIKHGMILDYKYFWGGRISCKRSLLLKNGVFSSAFKEPGLEDIELGYRLSQKAGLKIVYNEKAVSNMARGLTFDDFCRRLFVQGRTAYIFGRLYRDKEVQIYCEIRDAEGRWSKIAKIFNEKIKSARELDNYCTLRISAGLGLDIVTTRLLHDTYQWVFRACKLKGIIEAKGTKS